MWLKLFLTVAVLGFPQDAQVVRENWEDGSPRLEYETVPGEDGTPVRHGAFKRWFENGKLAESGHYERGQRVGRWSFRHDSGKARAVGAYRDGRRHGRWRFFDASGQKREEGKYSDGWRKGEWQAWLEDGRTDPARSGTYEYVLEKDDEGVRLAEGVRLNGARHGAWNFWWPNGELQLQGEFDLSRRHGEWQFHHVDGTPDAEMMSGRFEAGRWIGAATGETPEVDVEPTKPLKREAFEMLLPKIEGKQQLEDWLKRALSAGDEQLREEAYRGILTRGREVVPVLLEALLVLDLSQESQVALGQAIHTNLLGGVFQGTPMEWMPGITEADQRHNEQAVRRWFSLWWLTRESERFWQVELEARRHAARAFLWHPPSGLGGPAHVPERLAARFEERRSSARAEAIASALQWLRDHQDPDGHWDCDKFMQRDPFSNLPASDGAGLPLHDVGVTGLALLAFLADGNTLDAGPHQDVVLRATSWLLSQQDSSGAIGQRSLNLDRVMDPEARSYAYRWFACTVCKGAGEGACPSCAGAGRNPDSSACSECDEFGATVCAGCNGVGLILHRMVDGKPQPVDGSSPVQMTVNVYEHAIATIAFCELTELGAGRAVRRAAERAIGVVLRAQNPYGAWRYDLVPVGDNDSSITSWMVTALASARAAGIEFDRRSFALASEWFLSMTDKQTGRTGYSHGPGGGPGTRSSRLAGLDGRYPRELSEAITAAALWSHLAMVEPDASRDWSRHEHASLLSTQADLLMASPPVWSEDGSSCDFYYWYYGTLAMHAWAKPSAWKKWNEAVTDALTQHQQPAEPRDNYTGSWDPVGPWGGIGGRVYSTAIATLILTADRRYTWN